MPILLDVAFLGIVSCLHLADFNPYSVVEFQPLMELLTAVISGDRTFQVRVFAGEFLTVTEEVQLTSRLCNLVDRFGDQWAR